MLKYNFYKENNYLIDNEFDEDTDLTIEQDYNNYFGNDNRPRKEGRVYHLKELL
jgi:hypothetical protein